DDDEDPEEDPNEEHEPKDEEEPFEGSDETKQFEEDKTAITHHHLNIREQGYLSSNSPGIMTRTTYQTLSYLDSIDKIILTSRAADRVEDVGYVGALHASENRMMTSIDEVNSRISYQAQVRRQESKYFYTQLHDAQTDRRDIRLEIDVVRGQRTAYETELLETDRRDVRLEIDVVRGQRTAYETELREVHQAYLSSEARNRALLARLETLKTYMIRIEWQRQKARARADTVEDVDSGC
nr:hypothetical protein [Tanacetum cinerariifolium]